MAFFSHPHGALLDANHAFRSLTGLGLDGVLGKTLMDLGIVSQQAWHRLLAHLDPEEWVYPGTSEPPSPSGALPRELLAAHLVEGAEGPVVLCVFGSEAPGFRGFQGALQASEEKFRAIFDQASELVAILDMDGRVVEANERSLKFHEGGIRLEEVVGRPFWETPWWSFDGELKDRVRRYVARALSGEPVRFQSTQPGPEGEDRLMDNTLALVRDGGGRSLYLVVRGRDLTELLSARKALARSRERADLLANHAFEGLVFVDPLDGLILETNRRVEELLGYGMEELLGRSPLELISPDYRDEARQRLSEGSEEPYEIRMRRKDGGEVPIEVHGKAATLDGRTVRVSAIRDISWRRQAEEKLRESESRYASLVANIPAVTWIIGEDGTVDFISPNAERVFGGVSMGANVGRPEDWVERVHEEDGPVLEAALERLFSRGQAFDLEFRFKNTSGDWMWLHSRAVETFERDGKRFAYGVVSDVTERRSLQSQLFQAQKLEELGTLASGIAHDFNNLLVPIMGYGDCLAAGLGREDPVMKELEAHLLDAAERARDLVGQILTFSRKTESRFRTIPAHEPVQQAVRLVRSSLPGTIGLKTVIDGGAGMIWADGGQIQQVVMNLLTNAIHAVGEEGGEIELALTRCPEGELPSGDGERGEGAGHLCLTVSDTGVGIPDDRLPHIFDPFFTTKAPGEGTGLGLSMVHGIIRNHGGRIDVESELGRGSTFRVYLPMAEGRGGRIRHGPDEETSGNERVLVVDDQEASRETSSHLLHRLGYRVTTQDSPARALDRFSADPEAFDLALIDYDMPGMTGVHLALELLARRPGFPIVLMTGTDPSRIGDVARLGVAGRIMKPFTAQELGAVVRRTLKIDPDRLGVEPGRSEP